MGLLSDCLTTFLIVYHGCTLFSEPNTETSGEEIFGYQYRKEEKSDSLPLKGLHPLIYE
jgi:hypothetical protein